VDVDRHPGAVHAAGENAAVLRNGADAFRRQGEYLVRMRLAIDQRNDDRRIAVSERENDIALRRDLAGFRWRAGHKATLGDQLLGEIEAERLA
jgi:hypothetical protein